MTATPEHIATVVHDAARYLQRQPDPHDMVLHGVVLRINELHEQDHLDAEAIARRLQDTFAPESPLVQIGFVQRVITRLRP